MLKLNQPKQRILVVDDEPAICQTLRVMLTREGYEVQTAESGPEALTLLSREGYQLVITDFTMPGMKGDQLARLLHERWPQIGIILLSGSAEVIRTSGLALPGVDALFSKPFDVKKFRGTVALLLSVVELVEVPARR